MHTRCIEVPWNVWLLLVVLGTGCEVRRLATLVMLSVHCSRFVAGACLGNPWCEVSWCGAKRSWYWTVHIWSYDFCWSLVYGAGEGLNLYLPVPVYDYAVIYAVIYFDFIFYN